MIRSLLRLFRRTPPHLRGKVPQDSGEGTEPTDKPWTATADRIRPLVVVPPREESRESLRRDFDARTLTYSDGRTLQEAYARLTLEDVERGRCHENRQERARLAQQNIETPEEASRRSAASGAHGFYGPTDWLLASLNLGPTDVAVRVTGIYGGMACSNPEMHVRRPSPLENARRNTGEEKTW